MPHEHDPELDPLLGRTGDSVQTALVWSLDPSPEWLVTDLRAARSEPHRMAATPSANRRLSIGAAIALAGVLYWFSRARVRGRGGVPALLLLRGW